jgi:hypothetical protein
MAAKQTRFDPAAPKTVAEEAKVSPTTVFDHPADVVETNALTKKEKAAVLTQWEADSIALQTATDEGMTGGVRPRLDEVKRAQTMLGDPAPRNASRNASASRARAEVISSTRVRQGVTGHNVRYVLAFGLAGIIAAFILYGVYFSLT